MTDERMAYVGRQECGCVVAAVIDNPDHRTDVARRIEEWIQDGLTIERVTVEQARELFGCKCALQLKIDGMANV